MSSAEEILTPVGRLVQGSLYEPQTTDAEGKPLVNRATGEPRVQFYFALAIPKGNETHWKDTEWGTKIWSVGISAFPAVAHLATFSWKIADGDSSTPNSKGVRPCDRDGYAGCWVLNFTSGFAPSVHNSDGSQPLPENAVKPGDYIQVAGNVCGNGSTLNPGVFLNHAMVALQTTGKRIVLGLDPKSVGFGKAPLPANIVKSEVSFPQPVSSAPPLPTPHHAILTPPAARVMLPAASGFTYEQLRANGWSDEQLIERGMMKA